MKKGIIYVLMTMMVLGFDSCAGKAKGPYDDSKWVVDKFDDIMVLRYYVDGFDELSLDQKKLVYYLSRASVCGRDIIYDQNFKYNLAVRRTLETIYENYDGNKDNEEWFAFEKYLKKVWFANGIHHHYSNDKFKPEFSHESFAKWIASVPEEKFPEDFASFKELSAMVENIIFNPEIYKTKNNSSGDDDLLLSSAMNYYEGVSQNEAYEYYKKAIDVNDPRPISYGLNSKLIKKDGRLQEQTYKIGGMYSAAIEQIVYWLDKAAGVADMQQKAIIEKLISYYESGDLREFDEFNILWVQDTDCSVDFINGFTETYGDPLGIKAAWEGLVNFRNEEATKRTKIISENAQWFEDNSPIDPVYRKKEVKGVSAKVINAAMLGGDAYPATPIGINLPNADWIRKEHGSKSVTIQNITNAYSESSKDNGFREEFVLREEDRLRMNLYLSLGDNLHTDLHECLGHGSGQLADGVTGNELKQYASVLEETRADLFGLYYLGDDKMIELGLVPSFDVAKAEYAYYIMNGMMTQFARIETGKKVEEAHMRNRKLIAEWCYERGKGDNVIEMVTENGKTYVVVNDFVKLRELFGEMLYEIQRIKSEGDFQTGMELVEKYAVHIEPGLHEEVLERYGKLKIQPYSGFVNPVYTAIEKDGEIVDVKVSYDENYIEQMLDYSHNYSFLPTLN